MGVRKIAAEALSAASTGVLKHVFRRPAANLPGKVALYVDPQIIAESAAKLSRGSIIVVGTNGKTTTTNLLADALEASGQRVVCNRTGANLSSGVATALLQAKDSDWGVFESDELWMAKILPYLKSDYVLLLNLFRDQLDRMGEIDQVQASIVEALKSSPATVLIYNADDPLCRAIATAAPNKNIAFGLEGSLGLGQNALADVQMCQQCSGVLEYSQRQYGQLGNYHCDSCDFGRPTLDFAATDIELGAFDLSFKVVAGQASDTVDAPVGGAYMVYNLLACYVASVQLGVPTANLQRTIDSFNPDNGRLQRVEVGGRKVLLNLAKNPVGFNQNLKLIQASEGRKAAAFFVNDMEGDGHDISWLWDIDFEELATIPDLVCFAGGMRKNDLQVRMKYAGIDAQLVEGGAQVVEACSSLPDDYQVFLIANYTALPGVREEVVNLAAQGAPASEQATGTPPAVSVGNTAAPDAPFADQDSPVRIVCLYPELLNLYGDAGNAKVLLKRCLWRGISAQIVAVPNGQAADLSQADIVFIGGGPDREQELAFAQLLAMKDGLKAYVEDGGVLLAICGGYQMLGQEWLLGGQARQGLHLVDVSTKDSDGERLLGNIMVDSPLAEHPVVGFENHAGRTFLGMGVQPFGRVANASGNGNNDTDKQDGVCYKNLLASYLHGPLLGKNPEVADYLIAKALERKLGHAVELPALDDAAELAANAYMVDRLR